MRRCPAPLRRLSCRLCPVACASSGAFRGPSAHPFARAGPPPYTRAAVGAAALHLRSPPPVVPNPARSGRIAEGTRAAPADRTAAQASGRRRLCAGVCGQGWCVRPVRWAPGRRLWEPYAEPTEGDKGQAEMYSNGRAPLEEGGYPPPGPPYPPPPLPMFKADSQSFASAPFGGDHRGTLGGGGGPSQTPLPRRGGGGLPQTPLPPSPDQSDHRGEKRYLQQGKSGQAIFGAPSFGSNPPPPPPAQKKPCPSPFDSDRAVTANVDRASACSCPGWERPQGTRGWAAQAHERETYGAAGAHGRVQWGGVEHWGARSPDPVPPREVGQSVSRLPTPPTPATHKGEREGEADWPHGIP